MCSSEYHNLFAALLAALTDRPGTLVPPVDYPALRRLAKTHQIAPLLYVGLSRCGAPEDSLRPIAEEAMRAVCFDQKQLFCAQRLRTLLSENGLDFMPLKGSALKPLYPASELRLMSDIDVLIREEQYPRLRELLLENGFLEGEQTDHELVWHDREGMLIELHRRLIPSYNDDYYAFFQSPWKKAVRVAGCEYALRPEDEYVYLLTHLAKHYRDGGIGLRHMLDLWVYLRKHPELNRAALEAKLRRLQLDEFHRNITATLGVWFDRRPETPCTEHITRRILGSGSYGIREQLNAANAARQSARAENVRSARIRSLRRLVFLPYASMKKRYPVLERVPVLLPALWVARWFDAVFRRRDHIAQQHERLEQINPEVVEAYNRELAMVGLKFNLKHGAP